MLPMYTTGFCIYWDVALLKRAIHLLTRNIHGEGERQWQKKFVCIVVFTSLIPQPFAPNAADQLKETSKFDQFQESKIDCPHKKLKAKTILHDNKGSIVIAVVGQPRGSPQYVMKKQLARILK